MVISNSMMITYCNMSLSSFISNPITLEPMIMPNAKLLIIFFIISFDKITIKPCNFNN